MAEQRDTISIRPDTRPSDQTIAGTGPGIPDDALAPGAELPEPPTDEQVQAIGKKLGAPAAERDTLPLEGE